MPTAKAKAANHQQETDDGTSNESVLTFELDYLEPDPEQPTVFTVLVLSAQVAGAEQQAIHRTRFDITHELTRRKFAEAAAKRCGDPSLAGEIESAIKVKADAVPPAAPAVAGIPHETEPIPLEPPPPPVMPDDIFDGWLGNMIDGVAGATETPRELATIFALASMGIVAQGRFAVRVEGRYREPLAFWGATGLPPGSRKTPVMIAMMNWAFHWQRMKAKEMEPIIRQAKTDDTIAKGRIKDLNIQATKATDETERSLLKTQIADLEATLQPVPVTPRLLVEDVTAEHLATLLTMHSERLGITSDEGGFLDNYAGRYSNGVVNIDLLLKGHAGAPVTQDRGSRPPAHLRHPLLSIGLAPQPSVIAALAGNPTFRRRGLPARFIFLMPPSGLGFRTLNTRPVDEHVAEEYAARLTALAGLEGQPDGEGGYRPRELLPSGMAWRAWKDYALEVEHQMRPDGELETMTDFAGKLPGTAARIAGLLHVAEHGEDAIRVDEIHERTMRRAIAFCRFATPHAKIVFEGMDATGDLAIARRIWREAASERRRAERHEQYADATIITARDLWTPVRGTFKTTKEVDPAIRLLVDHNWLTEVANPEHGRAGRPSRRFKINPLAAARW